MNTKEKYTKKELETIEGFFTDSEWLAIEEALEDYGNKVVIIDDVAETYDDRLEFHKSDLELA